MNTLDTLLVRKHFPAFDSSQTEKWAFFENAGGTFPVRGVVDRLDNFYRNSKVQPYGHSPWQQQAGEAMDSGRQSIADLLGVPARNIALGPSTTQNFNTLAAACSSSWKVGDEVIVSEQDHEANIGAWIRYAKMCGATARFWEVDPQTGQLSLDGLSALLNERTRVVSVTHSSNIVGTINALPQISELVHRYNALLMADGVSYAPHGLPDIKKSGVDVYCFSTYKTFGTHMGVMYVSDEASQKLEPQCHYFNVNNGYARFDSAGPDHASIAALAGIGEYFTALHGEHGGDASITLFEKAQQCSAAFKRHENTLLQPVLDVLKNKRIRIYGSSESHHDREANVAISCDEMTSAELNQQLANHRIATGNGDFYAPRVLKKMGIKNLEDGVLRISFAHYNSTGDVEQLVDALDRILPNH